MYLNRRQKACLLEKGNVGERQNIMPLVEKQKKNKNIQETLSGTLILKQMESRTFHSTILTNIRNENSVEIYFQLHRVSL